jgi:RHS repeat-associated protein
VASVTVTSFGGKDGNLQSPDSRRLGYDQDTKLVRFGARDYNPTAGRWTAKDPILLAGGDTNLYSYVLDDPVNLRDPSGLLSNPFGLQSPFSGPNPFQVMLTPDLVPPQPPGWPPGASVASQSSTSSLNWWVNIRWSESTTVPSSVPQIGGSSLRTLIRSIPCPSSPPYSNPDIKNRFTNWLIDAGVQTTGPLNLPPIHF